VLGDDLFAARESVAATHSLRHYYRCGIRLGIFDRRFLSHDGASMRGEA
jgi:hypothetical protein